MNKLSKRSIFTALTALVFFAILSGVYNSLLNNRTNRTVSIKGVQEVSISATPTISLSETPIPSLTPTLTLTSTLTPVPPTPIPTAIASTPTPTVSPSITPQNFQEITINLKGQVYNDLNCNNTRDTGETGLNDIFIAVLHLKTPDDVEALEVVTSDLNGNYSFSKTIHDDQSFTIQPVPGVNLVHTPKEVTLNVNNKSSIVDLSSCPED